MNSLYKADLGLDVGDQAKQYIFTMLGECIGCIEIEIAQNLAGEKIKIVSDSHGGVGFISKGRTELVDGSEHKDEVCTVSDSMKYSKSQCIGCWMNKRA